MTAPAPPSRTAPPRGEQKRALLKRLSLFILVFSAVLLATGVFVCGTFTHFARPPGRAWWQLGAAGLSVSFVLATIGGRNHSSLLLRMVYALGATWLGVLNYGLFAAIACWIVGAALRVTDLAVDPRAIGAFCFGSAGLTAVFGLFNAAWIRTTRVELELPHLPDAWAGRTLALISDLHLGHLRGPEFVRRVIGRLRELEPDAVLISGDMFDGTTAELDRLVAPWSEYAAPRGIYFVTGNHDEFSDRSGYLAAVARRGIKVLHNEKVVINGLQVVGVHDSEAMRPQVLREILQRAHLDRGQPSILLAHQPANLAIAAEAGISLQLSGHTHRGQFWPWTLMVRRIYGRFAYGLNRLDDLWVYTSSGVGTWGPPFRVGTRSEIVLIRLATATR